MAPQATEICYLTLKPNVELEGSSSTAQAWTKCIKAVASQKGYLRCRYGRTVEKPELLLWFIGLFFLSGDAIPILPPRAGKYAGKIEEQVG